MNLTQALRAIVTGISGSGRSEYIGKVEECCRKAGKQLKVFNTGEMMFETARTLGFEIWEEKILDLSTSTLNYLRAAVFERILGEVDKYENIVINSHACFRWKKYLLQALDFHYLRELNPDLYVTIVDTVHATKARLESSAQWRGRMRAKDLIVWRDEEVFLTRAIAEFQKKPFYIIPYREPPETLYRLMFEKVKKAYLSYPITYVREREKMGRKDTLRDELRESGLVVFDPDELDDLSLLTLYKKAKEMGESSFQYELEGGAATFSLSEVEEVMEDIRDQTVVKDFQLIDQCDFLVVYYFLPIMSAGVLSEMFYGFTNNKHVYVVFEGPESPFFKYYSTKIFRSEEELFDYFRRIGYIK